MEKKKFNRYKFYFIKNGNLKKTGSDFLRYDLKTAISDLFRSCNQYSNLQLGIVIEGNPVGTEQKKLRKKQNEKLKMMLEKQESENHIIIDTTNNHIDLTQ